MIRILHAADLHLDSPFDALSEEKAALRRREQRELLRSLAGIRAEQKADLVLLSGDLFDSDAATARAYARRCVSSLKSAAPPSRWMCPAPAAPSSVPPAATLRR